MKLNILNNESDACSRCPNPCCKSMPGTAVPDDLKVLSAEHIAELLNTGDWSIDCWDAHPDNIYYLRPSTVNGRHRTYDLSWGGPCVFLGENGCKMPFEERPLNCRLLIPNSDEPGNCDFPEEVDEHTKLWFANHWIDHQDMLTEAAILCVRR